ncbi:MAG: DEAD/DEAH box helicase [Deltaproteobacteria bacterium]|nr:DEAD/DEAH box helicase [Deltaproteobacteria bacterium]
MGSQVVFHRVLQSIPARCDQLEKPWPKSIDDALVQSGIRSLYSHQVRAMDLIRSDKHVVVATPTASGKTLVYNLPMLEQVLLDGDARALYIFPLKALAQDQRRVFEQLAAACPGASATAAIYDGDTTAWHGKKIRQSPPHVLMTNPEMLHLSMLPYHSQWAALFTNLKLVVVDEVHTYRGILGSNMAQVFRRLKRMCNHYGSEPTFVFCSATVGNPAQLAQQLTGLDVTAVTQSGAPRGKRHLVLMDPVNGPARMAIELLKAALPRKLRTIVYSQSRKMAELIALWASNQAGDDADKISAYRAGFLPEERREIETRLARGDLLAVISTSALELGIDIGDLDLCILVGYPGTLVSTWQRSGRVGRGGQDSALVLIAGEDALDQFFLHNPEQLITQAPESAVVNPENPYIMAKHIPCAAAELILHCDDPIISSPAARQVVTELESTGDLLRSADGYHIISKRKAPHRRINLRGSGRQFQILTRETGERTGEIDGFRAFRETHPGAVYLHRGETYLVDTLDLETHQVLVTPARVGYYTRVMGHKETEILDVIDSRPIRGTHFYTGRLKVTDQVTGYEKWEIRGNRRLGRTPLDLPPQVFETEGIWFRISQSVAQQVESNHLHFMGGIHAIEHAAIGIFPLLVMTDRNDLGGISITYHPQVGSSTIFIYDGIPGGAGLCRQAFQKAEDLVNHTQQVIESCPCETGCPACVHSPKCGSGNRPIDKKAAAFILQKIRRATPAPEPTLPMAAKRTDDRATSAESVRETAEKKRPRRFVSRARKMKIRTDHSTGKAPTRASGGTHIGVFDLETQLSAKEVGGWHRADLMRISCGVLYDSRLDRFLTFTEQQVPELIAHLQKVDLVVGFNVKRFDYRVLSGYDDFDFQQLPTLDMLHEVHRHLGYRLSLDHLARVTLGAEKTADGLQALKWWKAGKLDEIIAYCRKDVKITRDLFLYGKEKGYLLFNNKSDQMVRVPVNW